MKLFWLILWIVLFIWNTVTLFVNVHTGDTARAVLSCTFVIVSAIGMNREVDSD